TGWTSTPRTTGAWPRRSCALKRRGDMPRHALALYTTVYPAVLRFLPEWWRSVAAQDCRGFQLWIGLDGVAEAQVRERIGWDIDVEWVTAPGANGIAVRRRAMKRIAERHEAVVFVDC